jgi:hypothetical protein
MSPDKSVRRSAQDDDFVGGLKYNWSDLQKASKIEKVTGSERNASLIHRVPRLLETRSRRIPAILILPIHAKPDFRRNPVPKGRLNLAQDASPGFILEHDPVPQGRLKLCQDAHKPSSREPVTFSNFSCFPHILQRNRHPERSASQIYRVHRAWSRSRRTPAMLVGRCSCELFGRKSVPFCRSARFPRNNLGDNKRGVDVVSLQWLVQCRVAGAGLPHKSGLPPGVTFGPCTPVRKKSSSHLHLTGKAYIS